MKKKFNFLLVSKKQLSETGIILVKIEIEEKLNKILNFLKKTK